MNYIEKCHIFYTQNKNKQINDVLFDLKNPMFETIYNHYANLQHVKEEKNHLIHHNAYSSITQPH
jgi:hypothetical protein